MKETNVRTVQVEFVKKTLLIPYISMFVVMVGYGVTLPVLPFYIERLALNKGATLTEATFHVGILNGGWIWSN